MADQLGDLKNLIADDLARSDLTSQIAAEINSAIYLHRTERFYFNEDRSVSFNTVASREFYDATDQSSIPDLYEIDSVRMTVNGTRYTLEPDNYGLVDRISTLSTATGFPSIYARYGQKLRFYPIPNSAYATLISAHVMLPPLGGDTSQNAWTQMADGGNLIRFAAEEMIYRVIIKDDESAARAGAERDRQLMRLRSETTKRISTGKVEPTEW